MTRDLNQVLVEYEKRKQELVAQLLPHQQHVRRSIFATIRSGLASQLHALLQARLFYVDERDYNECTPLHIAAHEGRQDMVSILISAGADPFAVDCFGRTARDLAAANRHTYIAGYLLMAMNHKWDQSSTPFRTPTMMQLVENVGSDESEATCVTDGTTVTATNNTGERSLTSTLQGHPLENSVVSPEEGPFDEDSVEGGLAEDSRFSHYCTISDNVCLVVCMVGLPGRGKSFTSKRIARYLNWKGVPCRVFNAGNYRRQQLGADGTSGADFYDPSNKAAKEQRERMAQLACLDLVSFLASCSTGVGILDATNTTVERRKHLIEYFEHQQQEVLKKPVRVLFIESVCTDESIITENILRAKCGNDDFKHVADTAAVVSEFRERIKQYEKVYESVEVEENVSFIKIINIKEHIVYHKIYGGIASRIVFFLLNLHPVALPLFVSLHGETEGNRQGLFGGSGMLTEKGRRNAESLKRFVMERCDDFSEGKFIVLHGTNPYISATVQPLQELAERGCIQLIKTRALDDINFGRMNGDSINGCRQAHPKMSQLLFCSQPTTQELEEQTTACCSSGREVHGAASLQSLPTFEKPRMNYCVQFPCGESCRQVNVRLESVLMSITRCGCPVLVVAPEVPAQGVIAFFTDTRPEYSPRLQVPRDNVVEITVKGDVMLHPMTALRSSET